MQAQPANRAKKEDYLTEQFEQRVTKELSNK